MSKNWQIDGFVYNAADGAAWHGLGMALEPEETRNLKAAAQKAGAAFTIIQKPDINPFTNEVDAGFFSLYNGDTFRKLHTVKERYTPIQPLRAMEHLENIVNCGFTISSIIVFDGGKKIAVSLVLDEFDVAPGDRHKIYAQLIISNDGLKNYVLSSSIRIVCRNTCQHALTEAKAHDALLGMSHTPNAEKRMLETENLAGIMGEVVENRYQIFNELAKFQISETARSEFFKRLLGNEESKQVQAKIAAIEAADGLNGFLAYKGSGFELLNKVTRTFHIAGDEKIARVNGKGGQISRLVSSEFGRLADYKRKAAEILMNLR